MIVSSGSSKRESRNYRDEHPHDLRKLDFGMVAVARCGARATSSPPLGGGARRPRGKGGGDRRSREQAGKRPLHRLSSDVANEAGVARHEW